MAYIGKQPTVGNFVVLDAITTSATTTFALTKDSVAYYPSSANHCIVSLNGIIQAPISSFTISGSNIVFSSALTSTDVIDFIQVLGDVLNIGTPSDNTVSLAKLTATGTKDSTTFLRGDNTFQTIGANTPSFSATNNTTLSLSNATDTLMTFQTENFDTDNAYDNTAGNYKFTVPSGKAGKYYFTACVYYYNTSVNNSILEALIFFKKNNTNVKYNVFRPAQSGSSGSTCHAYSSIISTVLDLAVGDYVQCYVSLWVSSGNPTITSNTVNNYFEGYKLI